MEKFFVSVFDFFQKYKIVFYVFVITSFSIIAFFASRIQLEEDISAMLPQDKSTAQLNDVLERTKLLEKLVIKISLNDSTLIQPETLILFADALADSLNNNFAEDVAKVEYRTDDETAMQLLEVVSNHLPLFLDSADYLQIDSLTKPEILNRKLESNYQSLISPSGFALKKFILNDPLGMNFMALKKFQALQFDDAIELYDSHFITIDKKSLLLFITSKHKPNQTSENQKFFIRLDLLIDSFTSDQYKNCSAFYFGGAAVAAGNASQIRSDSMLTSLLAIILIVVVIVAFFRNAMAPFMILLPVVFGAAFALACIYFFKGSISVIAIGAGSVVLGIAVNYSLHFLTHHKYHPYVRLVIKELAFPLTVGSFTTVAGFLFLQFVKSQVLKDLGLFAALSLVGAAIFTLIYLPHFFKTKRVDVAEHETDEASKFFTLGKKTRNYFVIGVVIITPVLFYFATQVQFESDMYKINYMSPKLQEAERQINSVSSNFLKTIYVTSSGKNLEEALQHAEQLNSTLNELQKQNVVKKYASATKIISSQKISDEKLDRWNTFWTEEKKKQLLSNLISSGKQYHFKETAFDGFKNMLATAFAPLDSASENVLKSTVLNNFIFSNDSGFTVVGMIKSQSTSTKTIYSKIENIKGIVAFDRQVLTDKLVQIVSNDFNFITIFTSLLVLMVLLLAYGRIELALITFIPMAVSWIWILGLMTLLGIKFNIINIILSTFIFALGDDYSIFMMDGLQQNLKRNSKGLPSVKISIVLSAVTTIFGMGVLIFAKHPALRSIAAISIIGILSVVITSQILIPALFNSLIKNRADKGLPPFTAFNIFTSAFAFVYFFVGAILLTVIGIILTKLIPVYKKQMKHAYHYVLSTFTGSLIYVMMNVKKTIINQVGEKFKTPAVVISNHQSFLDILLLTMINPKMVMLTKDWVWNNPVMGFVVRMADYYHVEEGTEKSLKQLSEKIKDGYSVIVFPEGSRQTDERIHRFHKGAFYLAEYFKMDILPIIIHGAGYTMSKGDDAMLKNGSMTLKYLPRIKYDDATFGATYQERTKLVCQYMRSEFKSLSAQCETPAYFKEKLFSNYIYKGPVLEWYMKVKVRLENFYKTFDELIPRQGHVLDIGCGYGFMSYMLHFLAPERIIKGIDYDEEKIAVANNCYSRNQNISFEYVSALEYHFEKHDAIILSDVLHYLQPEAQTSLLEKCINALNENGVLIIRDGIKELASRHRGTKLSELFSTKIFGFNKTSDKGLSFISSELIYEIASKFDLNLTMLDTTKFTSNVIFVLKK